MLKRIIFLTAFLTFMTILIGCGGGGSNPQPKPSINLSGFPYGINSDYFSDYYLVIYVWANNSVQKEYEPGKIPVNQIFTQTIEIDGSSTDISVYLLDPDHPEFEPYYFYQFSITPGVIEYSTTYWLDYIEYFTYGVIRFGISPSQAQNITSNYTANVDFDTAPYFLYKVTDLQGKKLDGKMTATEGKVQVVCDDAIDKVAGTLSGANASYKFQVWDTQYNPLCILLRPENYTTTTKASLNLAGTNYVKTDFIRIYKMIPSANPNLVYALATDYSQMKLLFIDPFNKTISQSFTLPEDEYDHMKYSAVDNKLYLSSYNKLTIWDLTTNQSNTITYSETSAYCLDIVVAPSLRRIYILGFDGFYILNMDTYAIITKGTDIFGLGHYSVQGDFMIAVNESTKKLFISTELYVGANLWRYSIDNDQITFEQSISQGFTYARKIVMSPDQSRLLCYPCDNNPIWDIDQTNLSKKGSWPLSYGPAIVTFSNDGEYLYACDNEFIDSLDVLKVSDYSHINNVTIPTEDVALTTNSDNTILVLFSTDRNNDPYLYFLDTSEINCNANTGSQFKGSSISKTLAKLIKSGVHKYPNHGIAPESEAR